MCCYCPFFVLLLASALLVLMACLISSFISTEINFAGSLLLVTSRRPPRGCISQHPGDMCLAWYAGRRSRWRPPVLSLFLMKGSRNQISTFGPGEMGPPHYIIGQIRPLCIPENLPGAPFYPFWAWVSVGSPLLQKVLILGSVSSSRSVCFRVYIMGAFPLLTIISRINKTYNSLLPIE